MCFVFEAAAAEAPGDVDAGMALVPVTLGAVARAHAYQGMYLASQPSPEDIEVAKKAGVTTVINLRHESEVSEFNERQVVESLGIEYLNLPFGAPDELTDEIFDRARQLLSDVSRPALMHCSSANRVGTVWLPWRVLDGGLGYEEALAEAKAIGLTSPLLEEKAQDYIRRHAPSRD